MSEHGLFCISIASDFSDCGLRARSIALVWLAMNWTTISGIEFVPAGLQRLNDCATPAPSIRIIGSCGLIILGLSSCCLNQRYTLLMFYWKKSWTGFSWRFWKIWVLSHGHLHLTTCWRGSNSLVENMNATSCCCNQREFHTLLAGNVHWNLDFAITFGKFGKFIAF